MLTQHRAIREQPTLTVLLAGVSAMCAVSSIAKQYLPDLVQLGAAAGTLNNRSELRLRSGVRQHTSESVTAHYVQGRSSPMTHQRRVPILKT